jgi:hypothetical protein
MSASHGCGGFFGAKFCDAFVAFKQQTQLALESWFALLP